MWWADEAGEHISEAKQKACKNKPSYTCVLFRILFVKLVQRHLSELHNFKNAVILFHVTTVIRHFLSAHLTYKTQHPHQLIPIWSIIQAVYVFMTDLY